MTAGTFRTEHDLLGNREVPADVYYGVHTLRAVENFPITGTPISIYPELIKALAYIKQAAAQANHELGLLDALTVVVLFAIFLWRGTRAAVLTQDNFGRFLAVGITSMIVLQAFINISVVLGLMPTKGIPLPFISYGGSSLFVTLACVGVLLNITKQAE